MRVSVIIPTYNSAGLVVEAVQSVLAQSRPADEILVIDDGSTDDTLMRLATFGNRVQIIQQANARVAAARNTGLRHATGDTIAFLDADDAWHPEKLARQLAVLERRPDIGLLATELTPWPGRFLAADRLVAGVIDSIALATLLTSNPLATSSIVVRQSILAEAGEFDTDLFGPEDYDLWLRCAQAGGVAMLREPLTGYRDVAGSLGKQAETMRRGLLRIHAKLAAAGIWRGRRLIRHKSRAHIEYSTGWLYYAAGNHAEALRRLVQSLTYYPLPMWPPQVYCPAARLRLLRRAAWAWACRKPQPTIHQATHQESNDPPGRPPSGAGAAPSSYAFHR